MKFLAALQFLTTIPIRRKFSDEEVGGSLSYFPLVGLILGLILAALCWLLGFLLPIALVDVLLIISLVALTGALHLDGFLDACDGLACHGTPQERLDIMSDSRAGGIGAVCVFSLLLLKYISLTTLPESIKIEALILMPVMGRWSMSYTIFAYPYAKSHGLGKPFKEGSGPRNFAIATGVTSFIALVVGWMWGLIVMFGIWIIAMGMASFLGKRFGGLTGDCYGAIAEVTEVGVLIMASLFVHNGWIC